MSLHGCSDGICQQMTSYMMLSTYIHMMGIRHGHHMLMHGGNYTVGYLMGIQHAFT